MHMLLLTKFMANTNLVREISDSQSSNYFMFLNDAEIAAGHLQLVHLAVLEQYTYCFTVYHIFFSVSAEIFISLDNLFVPYIGKIIK